MTQTTHTVTLFDGDGIGPEITAAVLKILDVLDLPITFERYDAGLKAYEATGELLPDEALASIRRNKVALKAPLTTPVGSGFRSINVQLRKIFDLYANIRPAKQFDELPSRFEHVDLVVFRENTEDLYIGEEEMVSDDEAIAIKRITRPATERIVRMAFDYAVKEGRKRVTCVHKANILKLTDGMFLKIFRKIAEEYPDLRADDMIVDNACMQLVMHPEDYDVLVMPNLYGDILSDLASGLIGGLGLLPSVNRNEEYAMFEAVHGSAPDIAGQGIANPTALLLSACMMLEHLGYGREAEVVRRALHETLKDPRKRTRDLGGEAGTMTFADHVVAAMR